MNEEREPVVPHGLLEQAVLSLALLVLLVALVVALRWPEPEPLPRFELDVRGEEAR